MAAELRDAFSIESELIAGDKGIFDVVVDGKRVFCKHDVDRFPEPGEIVALLG